MITNNKDYISISELITDNAIDPLIEKVKRSSIGFNNYSALITYNRKDKIWSFNKKRTIDDLYSIFYSFDLKAKDSEIKEKLIIQIKNMYTESSEFILSSNPFESEDYFDLIDNIFAAFRFGIFNFNKKQFMDAFYEYLIDPIDNFIFQDEYLLAIDYFKSDYIDFDDIIYLLNKNICKTGSFRTSEPCNYLFVTGAEAKFNAAIEADDYSKYSKEELLECLIVPTNISNYSLIELINDHLDKRTND